MVALIGASGSGKSTLLRHMSGLITADGRTDSLIEIDGRRVQQGGRIHHDIRRVRSEVGFVFQQFNLFPHLTVLDNLIERLAGDTRLGLSRDFLDAILAKGDQESGAAKSQIAAFAAAAISPTLSSNDLMLPGFTRTAAHPASIAWKTYLGWKWMSAMTGICDFLAMM